MACPRCGGTALRPIAPGFVECLSSITTQAPGPGYGAPPTGQFGPAFVQRVDTCGYRYHDGSIAAVADQCSQPGCGLYSIGVCVRCASPFCGDHLWREADQSLCPADRVAAQAAVEAEAKAKQAKEAAKEKAARSRRRARAQADVDAFVAGAKAAGTLPPLQIWDAALLKQQAADGAKNLHRSHRKNPTWLGWPVLQVPAVQPGGRRVAGEWDSVALTADGTWVRLGVFERKRRFGRPTSQPDDIDDLRMELRRVAASARIPVEWPAE